MGQAGDVIRSAIRKTEEGNKNATRGKLAGRENPARPQAASGERAALGVQVRESAPAPVAFVFVVKRTKSNLLPLTGGATLHALGRGRATLPIPASSQRRYVGAEKVARGPNQGTERLVLGTKFC
jgi:hypothetical protein